MSDLSEGAVQPGKPVRLSTTPAAKVHADIVSIHQDLAFAREATKRLIGLIDQPEADRDSVALNTYWSGALVAYARCFSSGKRFGLQAEIFAELPGDPLGAHQFYIDQRNKLIAHSVNPFEQVQVGFAVDDRDKVIGVAQLSMKLVAPDRSGCETLLHLIEFAMKFVAGRAETTSAELLAQGQQLSAEEVRALSKIQITIPPPDQAGKAR